MDTIGVLDFGGQYTHLIANRIRRLGVFSKIFPSGVDPEMLRECKGVILSGGPHSVLDMTRPAFNPAVFDLPIPILGLCYGHQLMAQSLGGRVVRGAHREYGRADMRIVSNNPLFSGLDAMQPIWMSHGDAVNVLPPGFERIGETDDCAVAAMSDGENRRFGLQFHPEVTDTTHGMAMLDNFIGICGCRKSWNPSSFMQEIAENVERVCAGRKVFLLVSGGVDSTVCFALLNKVLGPHRVLGLHIDNGLMRKDESESIMKYLREHGFNNLKIEDASQVFLAALDGITDPEQKRTIIGTKFLEVKQSAQDGLGLNADEWILGQGTIYPDTIESAGTEHADRIKTHHNRVDVVLELLKKGLVVEPLASLYKDEVRLLGEALGLPKELVWRHPFPGPGLGVRLLCSHGENEAVSEATQNEVSAIAAHYGYTATVLPVRSVGVQGDSRTYAHPVVLQGNRDWSRLEELSTALTNRVAGINRVVYKLTGTGRSYRATRAFVTSDRLDRLRRIDQCVTHTIMDSGEYDAIWQMPVVLLPVVDEKGKPCVVLRPVKSQEAMTARFMPIKDSSIDRIASAAQQMEDIGDIMIDVTHKPPATIEWE